MDSLKAFHDALTPAVTKAAGSVTWRAGRKVRTDRFTVAVEAKQQVDYAKALHALTNSFTTIPEVEPRPIQIE